MSEQMTAEAKPLTTQMREYVSRQVGCLSVNTSIAKQNLAVLRRGVGKRPDEAPEAWGIVFADAPAELYGQGQFVSKAEECVYLAMTLYAFASTGLHTLYAKNVSICGALSKLGYQEDSVKKYFYRLMTSHSFQELSFHMKQIISLCKSHDIGLDYGLLAKEVFQWYVSPESRKRVLRTWNQDFYRLNKESKKENK